MTSADESTVTSPPTSHNLLSHPRQILLWLACWGVSYLVVLQIWTPLPLHRIPRSANLYPLRFLDSETLLASPYVTADLGYVMSTGPLFVLHAPSGKLRRLEDSEDATPGPPPRDRNGWDNQTENHGGFLYGVGVVREFVVASTSAGPNDERVLRIWNWQTGREVFRHDCSNRSSGVMGGIAWTQPHRPPRAARSLELFRIPTGERVSTAIPAEEFDFAACPKSPDGRFVATPPERPDTLWNLDPGTVSFRIDAAAHAVFSSDSRWLATLSYREEQAGQDELSHIWQVYDVETGEVAAEHVVPARDHRHHTITFHDDDRCIIGYHQAEAGHLYPYDPPLRQFQEVDAWNWKEGKFRPYRASPALFSDTPQSALARDIAMPRVLIDRDSLRDLATGLTLLRKTDLSRMLLTCSNRWAILRDRPSQLAYWIYQLTGLGHPGRGRTEQLARLYDIDTRREGPRLGPFWTGQVSPDESWLVVSDQRSLSVWPLPARLPWWRGVPASLVAPVLLLVWQLRRRQRATAEALSSSVRVDLAKRSPAR